MNALTAVLIGAGSGAACGLVMISTIHRAVWGHWRFWRNECAPGRRHGEGSE